MYYKQDGNKILMFDVESIGFYGSGFAFGAIAATAKGEIFEKRAYACLNGEILTQLQAIDFFVNGEGKDIVAECKKLEQVSSLQELRQKLYEFYMDTGFKDNWDVYSDVNFPVETNFLADVAKDRLEGRQFNMPYPLFDVVNYVPVKIDRAEEYIKDNAYYIVGDVAERKPVKHNPLWDSM